MISHQKILVAVATAWLLTPCAAEEEDAGSQVAVPLSGALDAPGLSGMAAPLQLDGEDDDEDETESSPEQGATSIIATISQVVRSELSTPDRQWQIAFVALVTGALLIVNGEFCFKGILVVAIGAVVWITAQNEVSVLIGVDKHKLRHIAGIEAGLMAAIAAMRGIDGIMLMTGAWIGAGAAHAAEDALVHFGATAFHHNEVLKLAWYSVFILIGVAGIGFKKHMRLLALITPIMGGALFVSAASWTGTTVAIRWHPGVGQPESGLWIDFFRLLYVPDAPDVGLWAHHAPVPLIVGDQKVRVDKMVGCIFWFFLFVGGVAFQLTALKKARGKPGAKVAPDSLSALKEPLTATA